MFEYMKARNVLPILLFFHPLPSGGRSHNKYIPIEHANWQKQGTIVFAGPSVTRVDPDDQTLGQPAWLTNFVFPGPLRSEYPSYDEATSYAGLHSLGIPEPSASMVSQNARLVGHQVGHDAQRPDPIGNVSWVRTPFEMPESSVEGNQPAWDHGTNTAFGSDYVASPFLAGHSHISASDPAIGSSTNPPVSFLGIEDLDILNDLTFDDNDAGEPAQQSPAQPFTAAATPFLFCHICPFYFTKAKTEHNRKSNLQKHMRTKHAILFCSGRGCNKPFSSEIGLRKHESKCALLNPMLLSPLHNVGITKPKKR